MPPGGDSSAIDAGGLSPNMVIASADNTTYVGEKAVLRLGQCGDRCGPLQKLRAGDPAGAAPDPRCRVVCILGRVATCSNR